MPAADKYCFFARAFSIDSTSKRNERGAVVLFSCVKSTLFFSILQMIANIQSAINKTIFFEGNLTDEKSILYLVLCYKQESISLKQGNKPVFYNYFKKNFLSKKFLSRN